jgi:dUTP pyrophosphatase
MFNDKFFESLDKALNQSNKEVLDNLADNPFDLMNNLKEMNYKEKMELLREINPAVLDLFSEMGVVLEKVRGFEALPSLIVEKPVRGTQKSAGYDIRANESVTIYPWQKVAVKTGLTSFMQDDEFLDIRIRSGLAYNHDLTLQNDAGVVDSDYYGKEIKVMIRNEGSQPFQIAVGDRIAQGIFSKYLLTDDDKPSSTIRTDGFGHTGLK